MGPVTSTCRMRWVWLGWLQDEVGVAPLLVESRDCLVVLNMFYSAYHWARVSRWHEKACLPSRQAQWASPQGWPKKKWSPGLLGTETEAAILFWFFSESVLYVAQADPSASAFQELGL